MARKMLSGVLAFAMVFGCTAPVALAEAPVVEEVEQYAIEDITIADVTLTANIGASATAKVSSKDSLESIQSVSVATGTAGAAASDISVTTLTGSHLGSFKVEVEKGVPGAVYYVTVKMNVKAYGADLIPLTKTVDVNFMVKVDEAVVEYGDAALYETDADVDDSAINTKNVAVYENGEVSYKLWQISNDGKSVYTPEIEAVGTNAKTNMAVSFSGSVVTIKGIAACDKQTDAIVIDYVDDKGATKHMKLDVTVKAQDITRLSFVISPSSMKADNQAMFAVQAYKLDEYGIERPADRAQDVEWYINGQKVAIDEWATKTVNKITTETVKRVTVNGDSQTASYFAMYALVPGTYEITAKDTSSQKTATTTITVGYAEVEGIALAKKDDGAFKVKLGRPYDVQAKLVTLYMDAKVLTEDGIKEVQYTDARKIVNPVRSWSVELVGGKNGAVTAAEKRIFAKNVSFDGDKITIADNAEMKAMMTENGGELYYTLTATAANGLKTTEGNFTAVPYSVDPVETVTIIENDGAEDGEVKLVAGESIDLDVLLKDKDGFSDSVDQEVVWKVAYANDGDENYAEEIVDAITGKTYASITQDGKLYAKNPCIDTIIVKATSTADSSKFDTIKVTITGDAPTEKPTEAPTEKPADVYGVTTGSSLRVRTAPVSGAIVTKLNKGVTVKVLDSTSVDGWYKIETKDGTIGWVSAAYIDIVDDKPVVTNTATTTANLKLRKSAVSGTVITTMPKGSKVTVLEVGSNGWAKVQYNGKTGYASMSYLEFNAVG